jgi:alkylation response protein AidB-like acyl-CoA dehydrogenase
MSKISEQTLSKWIYGSTTPFAESSWAQGCPSPYYKDSHRQLRVAMRQWVETNIIPIAEECENSGKYPRDLYVKAARDGILMPVAAGSKIPVEWHGKFPIIGGVKPEDWDGFHDVIMHDEFGRVGGVGLQNSLLGSVILPMPAIQKFGSLELRQRVAREVLNGDKRLCLAITEPDAGSDVRGITSEIRSSEDRSTLILNGSKKWITGGMFADYFLTLAKDPEVDGMTLLVVERTDTITTNHMRTSGSGAAGTAFVEFDDTKVPAANVVGKRGDAFKYIASNFNHERLFMGIQALRCARVCLEDSINYAQCRMTFGKLLSEQPVIRHKIANMSRETEAAWAWMESLVYQIGNLTTQEADFLLAGKTAHFKSHAGIVLENVVREAVQIMGGIGLTRGGRGARVEQIWRDVKAIVVPGGSEEILLDFAVKRAFAAQKEMQQISKL